VHAALDQALVDEYQREGVVCVRGAFSPEEVELARVGIERVLTEPGPLAIRASPVDDAAFVEDFCRWSDVPELERLALDGPGGELTADLTGSRQVRLYHDHVLVKEPGTRQPTPWHQDQPYYDVDGRQSASIWMPVDPVPVEASLQVVAGSHRGPWYLPRTFLDGEARWFPEGSLEDLPDIEGYPDAFDVRSWALDPGDAVIFHFLALHGAGGVPGEGRRRVVSLRYAGDDVRHAARPWRTSPPFPDLHLADGDPLDDPRFPLVWDGGAP
jgi:ectoine hydroxylase-related dioxygenase (phytanoyl-CoA dioxygenase family)